MKDIEFWAEAILEFWRVIAFMVIMLVALITAPLWIIPYLIWKQNKK